MSYLARRDGQRNKEWMVVMSKNTGEQAFSNEFLEAFPAFKGELSESDMALG